MLSTGCAVSRPAAPARAAGRRRPTKPPASAAYGGRGSFTAAHVACCALAMPPSRFSRRYLVLLLLVAVATGVLARPAEAITALAPSRIGCTRSSIPLCTDANCASAASRV